MLKNWILYLCSLGFGLVFHAFYYGWYSWFVLMLLICLPLFTLLVSIPAMLRMRLQLEAPVLCARGDQIYLGLRGSCGRLPMPKCRFRLTMANRLTGQSVSVRQRIPSGARWYVSLDTTHCGHVDCSVDRSRVYDFLGLFWIPARQPHAAAVSVYPIPVQPSRLPNLSQFLIRQRRPKPGGGFSEEHELRTYRPGDNLRDVHWKVSVKTDQLIVREALEPVRGRTLLTLDLTGSPEELDSVLSQLSWLSQWLLEHDTPHQILWIDPQDCSTVCAQVDTGDDLMAILDRLLRSTPKEGTPSIAQRKFGAASWRYHLQPEEEVTP